MNSLLPALAVVACLVMKPVQSGRVFAQPADGSREAAADSNGSAEEQSLTARCDAAWRVFRGGSPEGVAKALQMFEEIARDTRKKYRPAEYPDGHKEIVLSLNALAGAYSEAGRAKEAVRLGTESHQMCQKLYPEARWPAGLALTARCLLNMANYYGFDKRNSKRKQCLAEADKLLKKAPAKPDVDVAFVQMDLADALADIGAEESARQHCLHAVHMAGELITDSLDERYRVAVFFRQCAGVLYDLGDLAEAKKYALLAVEVAEKLPPDLKGYEQAEALYCAGACCRAVRDYRRALEFLEQSYDLFEQADRKRAGKVAIEIAKACASHRQLARAELWLLRARKITKDDPDAIFVEAMLRSGRGDYDGAVSLFEKVLGMYERRGAHWRYIAEVHSALGQLETARGNVEVAAGWFVKDWQAKTMDFQRLLPAASEAAALGYAQILWQMAEFYLDSTRMLKEPDQVRQQYELVSQQRGLIVKALSLRHQLHRELTGEAAATYESYVSVSNKLAALHGSVDVPALSDRAEKLQLQKDILELRLAEQVSGQVDAIRNLHVPLARVQAALGEREMLIDFVRYRRPEGRVYAVFLVTADSVHRLDWDYARTLDQAVQQWRAGIAASRYDDSIAKAMYLNVWEPLEKFIPETVDTIYVCADGALLLMPWPALMRQDGAILLERFAIAMPPYPQYITRRRNRALEKAEGRMLAVGDVDYGARPNDADPTKAVKPLPHTRTELADVKRVVESTGTQLSQLAGGEATTQNVLAQLPKANWAHFATHGFFEGSAAGDRRRGGRNSPRERSAVASSGLILAGANQPGEPHSSAGARLRPGRLNGATIYNLDLHQTELVFLSACGTGIGDVFDGEGVFGLQRAFHVAGAKNVVCSLWQVDDAATAVLVEKFYDNYWTKGHSSLQSLRLAQLAIYRNPLLVDELRISRGQPRSKVDRPTRPKPTSPPAHWAGFIFSGVELNRQ